MDGEQNKFLWLTDIHLSFLSRSEIRGFVEQLVEARPNGLLIGGDVGEADSVVGYLEFLVEAVGCPIYFVLGNHDYYGSDINGVRKQVMASTERYEALHWLPRCEPVGLSMTTGLIGHGGWGDMTLGNYMNSAVWLNDFVKIGDFIGLSHNKKLLLERLRSLGQESASFLKEQLDNAFLDFNSVVVLTHVPPFPEATWHNGSMSGADWLPFFTCGAIGTTLEKVAMTNPDRNIMVLCGHTHSSGYCEVLPNLEVYTGGARYGKPEIQKVLNF